MANNELNKRLAKKMEEILEKTVEGLLHILTAESCEHCHARTATAQDFSNVLKFLKDNGFHIDPLKSGDALDQLIQGMSRPATYPQPNEQSN